MHTQALSTSLARETVLSGVRMAISPSMDADAKEGEETGGSLLKMLIPGEEGKL